MAPGKDNQITVGILLEMLNDKQVQQKIQGIVQANQKYAKSVTEVTKAETAHQKTISKSNSELSKYVKTEEQATKVSKAYTVQKNKEGQAMGLLETTTKRYTNSLGETVRFTEKATITDKKRLDTLAQQNAITKEQAMLVKQGVAAHSNMTAVQKLMIGQWETAYPKLDKLNRLFNSMRWSMVNMAFAAAAVGAAVAPFVILTKAGLDLELQLKRIQAVTGGTAGDFGTLQNLISARQGSPFSTSDAADSFLEITKAGFSASEAEDIMPHAITLATAGFTELSVATEILTATLHAYEVQGVTAAEATDIIAHAANRSALDVDTFGNSLSYVAPIAAGLGFTLEETSAALAVLSNAGLRGSKAGTTLRQVLNKIASPSVEAKQQMDALGISFFNTEGQMKSLSDVIVTLQQALSTLNEEQQAQILGDLFDVRGGTGVRAFMNASTESIDELAMAFEQAGYAAEVETVAMEAGLNRLKDATNDLKDSFRPLADVFADVFGVGVEGLDKVAGAASSLAQKGGKGGAAAVAGAGAIGVGFAGKALYEKLFTGPKGTPTDPMYVVDIGNGSGGIAETAKNTAATGSVYATRIGALISSGMPLTLAGNIGLKGLKNITLEQKAIENLQEKGELRQGLRGIDMVLFTKEQRAAVDAEMERIKLDVDGVASEAAISFVDSWLGATSTSNLLERTLNPTKKESEKSAKQIATNILKEVQKAIDDFNARDTPIANSLFSQFINDGGEINNSIGGQLSNAAAHLGNTSASGFIDDMTEIVDKVRESETSIGNLEEEQAQLNFRMEELRYELREAANDLDKYKTALDEVNKSISTLTGMRFEMETEFDKVMQAQREVMLRQQLEALGVSDVQSFIQDAIRKTGEEYDGVVDSIDSVSAATKNSKNDFKAWQTTVQEHIKSLIGNSDNLAADTTAAVRAHQTLLLSTSQFQSGGGGQTASELQMQKLQLASQLYFGGMHSDVELFMQADEDRRNGVASGSTQVIEALEAEFQKRDRLQSQLDSAQEKYDRINTALDVARAKHDGITIAISREKQAIDQLTNSIVQLAQQMQQTISLGGGLRAATSYGRSFSSKASSRNMNSFVSHIGSGGFQDLAKRRGVTTAEDFVARPNQPLLKINPNDTLIGFKGAMPTGETTINITLNASTSSDPRQHAQMLAQAIKRELRTR